MNKHLGQIGRNTHEIEVQRSRSQFARSASHCLCKLLPPGAICLFPPNFLFPRLSRNAFATSLLLFNLKLIRILRSLGLIACFFLFYLQAHDVLKTVPSKKCTLDNQEECVKGWIRMDGREDDGVSRVVCSVSGG